MWWRTAYRLRVAPGILSAIVLIAGCHGPDWRRLNSCKIVRDHSERHFVVCNEDVVVGMRIVGWGTYNDYFLVQKVVGQEPLGPYADKNGWAIIDSYSGTTTFTESLDEFNAAGEALGIPDAAAVIGPMYPQ